MTVHQAMAAVMAEIESVGKNDRNTQQGFNFRGIDAVVNAVGPALRKHSLIMVPEAGDPTVDHYESRGGAQMTHVLLPVTFRFYGPDGDSITCRVIGEASDAGDKVMSKAHSVAWRVALLECFAIPTDEPDPDAESHERAPSGRDPINWAALGWKDKAEHDAALSDNRTAARALGSDQQDEIRKWLAEQNYSLPFSRFEMLLWGETIDEVSAGPVGGGESSGQTLVAGNPAGESKDPTVPANPSPAPSGSRAGRVSVATGGTGSGQSGDDTGVPALDLDGAA